MNCYSLYFDTYCPVILKGIQMKVTSKVSNYMGKHKFRIACILFLDNFTSVIILISFLL